MKESHPITVAARELVKQITAVNVVDDQRDPKLVAVVVAAIRRINTAGDVYLTAVATGKRHRVRLGVPDDAVDDDAEPHDDPPPAADHEGIPTS